jgi:hypothetical protein
MWFKVHDQIPFDKKFRACSSAAVGLWVYAGARSSALLDDGFVPDWFPQSVHRAGDPDAAALAVELVDAGLWEICDGGWQMHDYSDWNTTKADRMEALEKKRAWMAKKRWRAEVAALPEDYRPQRTSEEKPTRTVRPRRTRAAPTK